MNKTRITALRIMVPIGLAFPLFILFDDYFPMDGTIFTLKLIFGVGPAILILVLWIKGEERYAEYKKAEEKELYKNRKEEKIVYQTIYKEKKETSWYKIILILAAIATIIATIKLFL